MIRIDGKNLSDKIAAELKIKVMKMSLKPTLAIVQVGDNDASNIYIKNKCRVAQDIGISVRLLKYMEDEVTSESLVKTIDMLNNDKKITGIIVQLPLAKHLNSDLIIESISPNKDVDGFLNINRTSLEKGVIPKFLCGPIKAIQYIFKEYEINISKMIATVIGDSKFLGSPIANYMKILSRECFVCNKETENIWSYTIKSDIVVTCVGKKSLINGSSLKDGAIGIDIGIVRVEGKLYGDFDYDSCKDVCSYLTPVPGGVGPLTIIGLMENIVDAHTDN